MYRLDPRSPSPGRFENSSSALWCCLADWAKPPGGGPSPCSICLCIISPQHLSAEEACQNSANLCLNQTSGRLGSIGKSSVTVWRWLSDYNRTAGRHFLCKPARNGLFNPKKHTVRYLLQHCNFSPDLIHFLESDGNWRWVKDFGWKIGVANSPIFTSLCSQNHSFNA